MRLTEDAAESSRVELGDWNSLKGEAIAIRTAVFVDEQRVPIELELDEFDGVSVHALARNATARAVGTGRLLPDGHIGRMAVLKSARGAGVGGALLRALMDEASRRGFAEVTLNAQTHAIPFYRRFGFVEAGGKYDDAGIPHVTMRARI